MASFLLHLEQLGGLVVDVHLVEHGHHSLVVHVDCYFVAAVIVSVFV